MSGAKAKAATCKVPVHCSGDRWVDVDAIVFGTWAAHPMVTGLQFAPHAKEWNVTDVPSGKFVTTMFPIGKRAAIKLAKLLNERFARKGGVARAPKSVKKAIRAAINDFEVGAAS